MKEGKIYLHIECKECLNRQQAGHLAVLAAKEEDWQLKYDLQTADYEQKWGLSMRQAEQIAALKAENADLRKCIEDEAAMIFRNENTTLKTENKRLRELCAELVGDDMKKEIE